MKIKRGFAAIAVVITSVSAQQIPADSGIVQGVNNAFLGIPFAAPPVGSLRFRTPQPPERWDGVRDVQQLPPPCPQQSDGEVIGSEDCLYLNVWTKPANDSAPVLVFVHGGGNVQGSTSEQIAGQLLYDGGRIVDKADVVVVTIQYRLGLLGNLAIPEFENAGNFGLYDIIAALKWVQNNITAFGGDPRRVLLFGESAGAINTCVLTASPLAKGLFSRALMESGACLAVPKQTRYDEGKQLAAKIGCSTAECLRNAPVEDIVNAIGGNVVNSDGTTSRFVGATIDGTLLPAAPMEMVRRKEHNAVPFVIGSNAEETALFGVPPMTELVYRANIIRIFGDAVGALVLREYPASAFSTPREALIAVTTDAQFTCTARNIARTLSDSQGQPVYRYFFTHGTAFHGLELKYVFQSEKTDDPVLQDNILRSWTNFAANGFLRWPRYESSTDPYLRLDTPLRIDTGVRTAHCDFWDRLATSR